MDGDRFFQGAANRHPGRQGGDGILQQQLRAPAECKRRLRELLGNGATANLHPCRTRAA
jgi:hypothetical protein